MQKAVKHPIENGYCKVPMVMQMEALECGAACLTMVLAYYDKWLPLEQVRRDCGVSRDGSRAGNVLRAARNYGLEAAGFKMEPEALKANGSFPCIIHWNFNHFVVLCGFKGDKVFLNDPAKGVITVSMEEFDDCFTGVCLMFKPGADFEPSGEPKSIKSFILKRLEGSKAAVIFVLLTSVISSFIAIVDPIFMKVFADKLLGGQNPDWAKPFIWIVGLTCLLQLIVSYINDAYSTRVQAKLSAVGNASYMWKIMHLPMNFFSQRLNGDILVRKEDNSSITGKIVYTIAPLCIDIVMMVFYLIIMVRYSWILSLIGISSVVLTALLSFSISNKRANITRVRLRDQGKKTSSTLSALDMIETIKSSGAENGYFEKWAGYQSSLSIQDNRYLTLNSYIGLVPGFICQLCNILILGVGIYLSFSGNFSIGSVLAFQGFYGSFASPAASLISAKQTMIEMTTQAERVEDVMLYPEDNPFGKGEADKRVYEKLKGNVELKDISFGYSVLEAPIIRDFSMKLEPGKSVAIVGMSGCGKSTITKLMSGLYQPWSGEITYDGKHLSEIDKYVFNGSLAVVDQDIVLFEDTLENNIKMWDNSVEDFEMILAARDAQIHEDIMMREGGYKYKISEGGRDFSGGQRQRIEIARVLAQDPVIIILDEATSALDARTEYEVVNAIKKRGISCVVVAHRLSTIRDCEEIIVLDHGEIAERGTHDELMALNGEYVKLVQSN